MKRIGCGIKTYIARLCGDDANVWNINRGCELFKLWVCMGDNGALLVIMWTLYCHVHQLREDCYTSPLFSGDMGRNGSENWIVPSVLIIVMLNKYPRWNIEVIKFSSSAFVAVPFLLNSPSPTHSPSLYIHLVTRESWTNACILIRTLWILNR